MNNKAWDKLYKHLAVEQNKKRNDWKSTGRIFPSSSGVNCEVKLKYDFIGANKELNFIWHGCENKIGDVVHKFHQDNFKAKFGERVKIEQYAPYYVEGLKINAKYDILIDDKTLIDIKTVKKDEVEKNHKKNTRQMQWYMGVLKLGKSYLSYFNRENGIHLKTLQVDFEQKVFDHIVDKFARVIRGAKNLRADTRECKFCPYTYTCEYYKKQW